MLTKYLDEEEIDQVYETFEKNVFTCLDERNVDNIILYLKKDNLFFKDMLIYYLDLFTIDIKEFIYKFEKLKKILGDNYKTLLELNIDLLERIYQL